MRVDDEAVREARGAAVDVRRRELREVRSVPCVNESDRPAQAASDPLCVRRPGDLPTDAARQRPNGAGVKVADPEAAAGGGDVGAVRRPDRVRAAACDDRVAVEVDHEVVGEREREPGAVGRERRPPRLEVAVVVDLARRRSVAVHQPDRGAAEAGLEAGVGDRGSVRRPGRLPAFDVLRRVIGCEPHRRRGSEIDTPDARVRVVGDAGAVRRPGEMLHRDTWH